MWYACVLGKPKKLKHLAGVVKFLPRHGPEKSGKINYAKIVPKIRQPICRVLGFPKLRQNYAKNTPGGARRAPLAYFWHNCGAILETRKIYKIGWRIFGTILA
jgi:hypothetical protein